MQTAAAMVAAAIVVVAVAGRMITSFAIHPKHINEYGTVHHFIHVLQRGKVICASHIAVFETIVKNLLRQRNLPKTTSSLLQLGNHRSVELSPQSKAHHEYGHECIISFMYKR